jgi:hypothetical protein
MGCWQASVSVCFTFIVCWYVPAGDGNPKFAHIILTAKKGIYKDSTKH